MFGIYEKKWFSLECSVFLFVSIEEVITKRANVRERETLRERGKMAEK